MDDTEPNTRKSPFYFPDDLLRIIFELAARRTPDAEHPRTANQLVLVSRRAQVWMEKIIYAVVSLVAADDADKFISTFENKPPSFFENVRCLVLMFDVGWKRAAKVLDLCSSIEDFSCFVPQTLSLPRMAHIAPRRLRINATVMGGDAPSPQTPPPPPKFAGLPFSNVTHLLIVEVDIWWNDDYRGYEQMPHLTHLGLSVCWFHPAGINLLRDILVKCPGLRFLWLRLVESREIPDGLEVFGDPRVVMTEMSTLQEIPWGNRWKGEEDYWAPVEKIARLQAERHSLVCPIDSLTI